MCRVNPPTQEETHTVGIICTGHTGCHGRNTDNECGGGDLLEQSHHLDVILHQPPDTRHTLPLFPLTTGNKPSKDHLRRITLERVRKREYDKNLGKPPMGHIIRASFGISPPLGNLGFQPFTIEYTHARPPKCLSTCFCPPPPPGNIPK